MGLSIFAARTLTADVNAIMPVGNFIVKSFFGEEKHSDTKYVDIVVKKGGRELAPFVSPKIGGKVMKENGKTLNTYEPPMLKPKYVTDAEELFESQTAFYADNSSPEQRAAERVAEDLGKGKDAIYRRIEVMATNALLDGKITVKGDGVEDEIDFSMDAGNKVVLTGSALWSDTGSDPLQNIDDWCDQLFEKSGKAPDRLVLGAQVAASFKKHAKVVEAFDTRRINRGELAPRPTEDGVFYIGHYGDRDIDIYSYNDKYTDEDGTTKSILPGDKLILGSTKTAGHVAFGGIADYKTLQNEGIGGTIFVGSIFAKSWTSEDPSARFILLQSKPLPIPAEIDAFLSAKAV